MLAVPIHVLHADVDVLRHLPTAWRTVFAALASQHDGALRNGQLRVRDDAPVFSAQALDESKGSAQPVDCLADICVYENWDHGRGWRRAIGNHAGPPWQPVAKGDGLRVLTTACLGRKSNLSQERSTPILQGLFSGVLYKSDSGGRSKTREWAWRLTACACFAT